MNIWNSWLCVFFCLFIINILEKVIRATCINATYQMSGMKNVYIFKKSFGMFPAFMFLEWNSGAPLFLPICLCVCGKNFKLGHNFWKVRKRVHILLMKTFQLAFRSITLWLWPKTSHSWLCVPPVGSDEQFVVRCHGN